MVPSFLHYNFCSVPHANADMYYFLKLKQHFKTLCNSTKKSTWQSGGGGGAAEDDHHCWFPLFNSVKIVVQPSTQQFYRDVMVGNGGWRTLLKIKVTDQNSLSNSTRTEFSRDQHQLIKRPQQRILDAFHGFFSLLIQSFFFLILLQ